MEQRIHGPVNVACSSDGTFHVAAENGLFEIRSADGAGFLGLLQHQHILGFITHPCVSTSTSQTAFSTSPLAASDCWVDTHRHSTLSGRAARRPHISTRVSVGADAARLCGTRACHRGHWCRRSQHSSSAVALDARSCRRCARPCAALCLRLARVFVISPGLAARAGYNPLTADGLLVRRDTPPPPCACWPGALAPAASHGLVGGFFGFSVLAGVCY